MTPTLLIAVVSDPLEEQAIEIARKEGVHGVTVLPGRGIGFPEHTTFFGLTFQGLEKVLLWITDAEAANRIAERLNIELDLLAPQRGLAFSLKIDRIAGLAPGHPAAAPAQDSAQD